MATELDELVDFLSCPSLQVKKAAVDIVRGLTGSEETLISLSSRAGAAIPALCRLIPEAPDLSVPAAETLVNLSQDHSLAEKIVSHGVIHTIMEVLYKGRCDSEMARLLVMLLVNLTQSDSGVSALLQIEDDKLDGLYICKLVRSFCTSSMIEATGVDPFEHVGSILVNISKTEFGRKVLLEPKRSLLKQIIPQYDSVSLLRKKGVSGTIRNCCFGADYWINEMLSISEFLWPVLLLPVAGMKAYNQDDTSKMPPELGNILCHEREPIDDPELCIEALDSIYLITLQESGRRAFWSVNGPRILQVGYENEEDSNVMEAYERIGSLLLEK